MILYCISHNTENCRTCREYLMGFSGSQLSTPEPKVKSNNMNPINVFTALPINTLVAKRNISAGATYDPADFMQQKTEARVKRVYGFCVEKYEWYIVSGPPTFPETATYKNQKIPVIKMLRQIHPHLGLMEAKQHIEMFQSLFTRYVQLDLRDYDNTVTFWSHE